MSRVPQESRSWEGAKYLIAVQCIIAKPFETVEEHKGGKKNNNQNYLKGDGQD